MSWSELIKIPFVGKVLEQLAAHGVLVVVLVILTVYTEYNRKEEKKEWKGEVAEVKSDLRELRQKYENSVLFSRDTLFDFMSGYKQTLDKIISNKTK